MNSFIKYLTRDEQVNWLDITIGFGVGVLFMAVIIGVTS